jgi:hypothetical protein
MTSFSGGSRSAIKKTCVYDKASVLYPPVDMVSDLQSIKAGREMCAGSPRCSHCPGSYPSSCLQQSTEEKEIVSVLQPLEANEGNGREE